MSMISNLYDRFRHLIQEALKFGLIGILGLFVDLPIYNWLVFNNPTVLGPSEVGMLHHKPLTAKIIATVAATIATYLGNRFWTWRHRERSGMAREYVMFFVLNGIALLIAAGCLAFSRYVLGLHSWLADNLSANFIGLGLGTLFRFWSYRRFVFREELRLDAIEDEQEHQEYLLRHDDATTENEPAQRPEVVDGLGEQTDGQSAGPTRPTAHPAEPAAKQN